MNILIELLQLPATWLLLFALLVVIAIVKIVKSIVGKVIGIVFGLITLSKIISFINGQP